MARLREPQRFQVRVLAPTWISPARMGAVGLALGGLVLGGLALGGVLPAIFTGALWGVPLGLGGARLLRGQRAWSEAELELHEGQATIRGAGPGVDTLEARKIRALSTATGDDGIVVAVNPGGLALEVRDPVLIRVDDPIQADTICDALAVGNRGLGALEWFPQDTLNSTLNRRISWLLVLASLVGILFWSTRVWPNPMPVVGAFGALVVQGILRLGRERRKLRLDKGGLDLSGLAIGWGYIPYPWIEEVRRTPAGIELILGEPYPRVTIPQERLQGLSEDELAHLMDQVRSACLRTRGLGRPERDPEVLFDGLRRGEESIARWLHRLESQASAMQSGAYRAEGHNASELWEALDNHDASPEIRVAAARMLVRVQPQEARLRVAQLAREQREPGTREALELAAEEQDLEELARRLEECGLWAESATREEPPAS